MIAVPKIIPLQPGCLVKRIGASAVQPGWSRYEVTYWEGGRAWRMLTDSALPYGLSLISHLLYTCPDHCECLTP